MHKVLSLSLAQKVRRFLLPSLSHQAVYHFVMDFKTLFLLLFLDSVHLLITLITARYVKSLGRNFDITRPHLIFVSYWPGVHKRWRDFCQPGCNSVFFQGDQRW